MKTHYDKNNKNHLLIQPRFWNAIVSGDKEWEYRKLSKGLTRGYYDFFSTEDDNKLLGSCFLYPNFLNSTPRCTNKSHIKTQKKCICIESAHFTFNNYLMKNKDFIAYSISNVKVYGKDKDEL